MGVTAAVRRSLRLNTRMLPDGVRFGRVALTLVVSIALFVLALHVPAFMSAGADMTDSAQRDYAANIWQETQTSLALVALVLPWLVYALLWQGAPWGRRILLALATAGVVVTTWFAVLSAQSYAALPRHVVGVVDRVQGRVIALRSAGSYYLVLSDAELNADRSWLHPGASVELWVSPRGHAGAVSAVSEVGGD
jgi:ABC-type tungstate transport system substrate-binding protein